MFRASSIKEPGTHYSSNLHIIDVLRRTAGAVQKRSYGWFFKKGEITQQTKTIYSAYDIAPLVL